MMAFAPTALLSPHDNAIGPEGAPVSRSSRRARSRRAGRQNGGRPRNARGTTRARPPDARCGFSGSGTAEIPRKNQDEVRSRQEAAGFQRRELQRRRRANETHAASSRRIARPARLHRETARSRRRVRRSDRFASGRVTPHGASNRGRPRSTRPIPQHERTATRQWRWPRLHAEDRFARDILRYICVSVAWRYRDQIAQAKASGRTVTG